MFVSDLRIPMAAKADADILAFARGHSEAASSIHDAVLAALIAETVGEFAAIVTRDWPWLLGVDHVTFAWARHGRALIAERGGQRPMEARLVARMAEHLPEEVTLRAVTRGHMLFGSHAGIVRAEALTEYLPAAPTGLVELGAFLALTAQA